MPTIQKKNDRGFDFALTVITVLMGFLLFSPGSAASSEPGDKFSSLSDQIIQGYSSVQEVHKERIAVVGFTTLDGDACEISDFISEKMTLGLSKEKNFELISRANVKKAINENSKASHQQIGNLLGATAIVTGIVMDMGSHEEVNAWLIQCDEQEKVLSSAKAVVKKDLFKGNAEGGNPAIQKSKDIAEWKWLEDAGLTAQTEEISETFNLPQKVLHEASGIVLVLIHPGSFLMGSPDSIDATIDELNRSNLSELEPGLANLEWERPQHEVVISRPFYMGQSEVSNKQFRRLFTLHNSGSKYGISLDTDEKPAVNLTRYEAEEFCREYGMRLPTEAEWEFCARAGTDTLYSWGNNPDDGSNYCNVRDIEYAGAVNMKERIFAFSDGYVVAAPVGTFKANAFGLHDMHGNVWEWCKDGFQPDFYKEKKNHIDPLCEAKEFGPVLRGGSWSEGPQSVRSAHRFWCGENSSAFDRGLRVVLDIPTDVFENYEDVTEDAPTPVDNPQKSEVKAPKTAVQARLNKIDPLFDQLKRLKDVNDPNWKIINRNMFIELKFAMVDYPYSAEVYYYYARAYYIHGNWKGATKFLLKTFYYDPHYVDALVFKGDMDYDFGKKCGMHVASKLRLDMTSREAYEAAANLREDKQFKAMIYLKIGDVYADLSGDRQKAQAFWQKCIATAPDSEAALQAGKRMNSPSAAIIITPGTL